MKIERISDTQIKFLISNEELKKRKIELNELAFGSEKAQAFFKDIMLEAKIDCGFEVDSSPLMIEAMPTGADGIMIIVSKVETMDDEFSKKISLSLETFNERKFKQTSIKKIENEFSKLIEEQSFYIYSFLKFDQVVALANRISKYNIKSSLYKSENKYYIVIQKNTSLDIDLEPILSEYGEKHVSNIIAKYHLIEHGEALIKEDALEILVSL